MLQIYFYTCTVYGDTNGTCFVEWPCRCWLSQLDFMLNFHCVSYPWTNCICNFICLGIKLIDWWLMIFYATSSLDPWQNWSQLKLASKNNFFSKKYEVQLRGKILFSAITIFVLLLFWIMHNPSIILYLFIMLKLFWPQYYSELPNHLPPTLLLTAVFLCGLYCVTAIKAVLLYATWLQNLSANSCQPVPTQNECIPLLQSNIYNLIMLFFSHCRYWGYFKNCLVIRSKL